MEGDINSKNNSLTKHDITKININHRKKKG